MANMLVKKRDNSIVVFDRAKITTAVKKAAVASGEPVDCVEITNAVIKTLDGLPSVEYIQDQVELSLFFYGWFKTARAFIAYREQHARLRSIANVNAISSINDYLDRSDWRVNANANQDYSLGGLILNSAGKMIANYWLSHVYSPAIGQAHRDGDYHIHDLDFLSGYCAGWSLRQLLEEGFGGVNGRISAIPPQHFDTAIGQMVNFLGTLQNEWAGAQAFSSFDTYLAPYVYEDRLNYKKVKQGIQSLIYNLNVPSRWGSQAPFSNLTFDLVCPADLRSKHPKIGGKELNYVYGERQAEMDMINRAYMEVMTKGDELGRVFTFPIPTYNITPDFQWNSPLADSLFAMTAKYGLPYFQNFLASDLKPHMVRSMCCRLQLDLGELVKRGNGLFGSAEQTGSIGIVTINCARLGYVYSGDWGKLIGRLGVLLELAKDSLETKRKVIQRHMDNGLFPYTKRYLGTLRNHFSTIGVNGINEMIRNFTNGEHDITTNYGHSIAADLLDYTRSILVGFQESTGHMYNLEATPAEGATYRFAKEDQKRFPNILQAGTPEAPYYTNSSQLPVGYTSDAFLALEMQEDLQARYTGGTVLHLFLGERTSPEACKKLVKRALERFRVPYLTISPTFSICPVHGYLAGEHEFCPICDGDYV